MNWNDFIIGFGLVAIAANFIGTLAVIRLLLTGRYKQYISERYEAKGREHDEHMRGIEDRLDRQRRKFE